MTYMFAVVFKLSYMYVVHVHRIVHRTCTVVRRTCMSMASYYCGHALFFVGVMADRL